VQPFLHKCFDGIDQLEFQSNLDITACMDPTGERIPFTYKEVQHKIINPSDSGGNVEKWLVQVEIMMKKSLAYAIDQAVVDYSKSSRIDWLQRCQGQVMLVVNQIAWTAAMETAIKGTFDLSDNDSTIVKTSNSSAIALAAYHDKLQSELLQTVELVRTDIPKRLRTSLGAITVMDVHNRDVTAELQALNVSSVTEFDWLAQLRYYWNSGETNSSSTSIKRSALTGEPGSIVCKIINAVQYYAYEYLGNNGRLVITPLTDRCYRTLVGAIHLNLGGAPEGPAGMYI
jgi:dynein heavy chain, axonemal